MTITLKDNKGFQWFKNNTIFFKGYFYIDAIFYEKENALNYLATLRNESDFKEILRKINGVFTLIITNKKNIYIASDITRSFPIFYTFQNDQLILSDDILHLKDTFNLQDFDNLSEIEFKASNHTHGKKTLLTNVFQVQASEYLIIKNEAIVESNFFYSFAIKSENSDVYETLKSKTFDAFENAFNRFIKSLNNKKVIVPLSGGYDSRLIAVMLKKFNYKNVLCYTYGRKDSFEIENSKKTAEQLNFKWIFIEYDHQLIKGYLESEKFKEYAHFAGKHSSMPYLQEYFAVHYLKEHNLITDDSIFVPGFAGDFLGGSQFVKVIPENLKSTEITDLIISTKFSNHRLSAKNKKLLKEEITKNLKKFDSNYLDKIPTSVFENYDIHEKISKFVFNSASIYTFLNFEHRFPFWDRELLDFFKEIPVKHKQMKVLFDDVLVTNYFEPYKVNYQKEIQPSKKRIQVQQLKNKIKPFLPAYLKQRFLEKHDWINYKPITHKMLRELQKKELTVTISSKDYNEIITQWYLYFCKNKV
jgi:asparagine synthase (glutamine-hydrolysing)